MAAQKSKKLLAYLVVALLLMSLLPVLTAKASDGLLIITADKNIVSPGETVTLSLSLETHTPHRMWGIQLQQITPVFSYVSHQFGSDYSDWNNSFSGNNQMLSIRPDSVSSTGGTFLGSISYKVGEAVADGDYTITIEDSNSFLQAVSFQSIPLSASCTI